MRSDARGPQPDLTELDSGERFARMFKNEVRYCSGRGWLRWTGTHWAATNIDGMMPLAKQVAKVLRAKAAEINSQDAWRHAQRIGTARGLRAMLDLAQSEKGILVDASELDAVPHLLAVENGVVDLRDGSLRPHDPKDLITRLAPTHYDPAARHADVDRVLQHLLSDDEVRAYAQRLLGYAITGNPREHLLVLLVGRPRCGKGTLLRALRAALGDHYAEPAAESFCRPAKLTDPDRARSDLASLVGRRVVAIPEGVEDRKLNAGLAKSLSGGDTIAIRDLYGKTFYSTTTFVLVMVANEGQLPQFDANDQALWERVRRLPVGSTVPEHERDPGLSERVMRPEARSAFLAWLVAGAVAYHRGGLGRQPVAVRAAAKELREESDRMRPFIDAQLVFAPEAKVSTSDLHDAVSRWFAEDSEKPSHREVVAALRTVSSEIKATSMRVDGKVVRGYRGVALREEGGDEDCRHVDACRRQELATFAYARGREVVGTSRLHPSTRLHAPEGGGGPSVASEPRSVDARKTGTNATTTTVGELAELARDEHIRAASRAYQVAIEGAGGIYDGGAAYREQLCTVGRLAVEYATKHGGDRDGRLTEWASRYVLEFSSRRPDWWLEKVSAWVSGPPGSPAQRSRSGPTRPAKTRGFVSIPTVAELEAEGGSHGR